MDADLAKWVAEFTERGGFVDMEQAEVLTVKLIAALREAERRPDVAALVKEHWPEAHPVSIIKQVAEILERDGWHTFAGCIRALASAIGEPR